MVVDTSGEVAARAAVVVARRPILDRERHVVGFELVYHPHLPPEDRYPGAGSGVVAVHELLRSHDLGLEEVVGDTVAFCHVDREVLTGDGPLMLTPRRTVLLVRDPDVDDELVAACATRRVEGYLLALDGLRLDQADERLLELADVLVVDVAASTQEEAEELLERCRPLVPELLARGCDTEADVARAEQLGCTLFQGRAVQAPPVPGAPIAPSALAQVRLALELLTRDLDMDQVERILRGEPALVAQVLDLASVGRHRGLREQVRSVREALVVMGTRRLQRWAAVTVLGRHATIDTDAVLTGLVRGRTCELLAHGRRIDPDFAFTAGLLSTLDLVLGVELEQIETQLDIDDDLVLAAFRREGGLGTLVTSVADYQGALATAGPPDDAAAALEAAVASAFRWSTTILHAM